MIDLIQNSIKELKLHNAKKREYHIDKLLDYYNGNDTANYISRMFAGSAFSEIPPVETKITRKRRWLRKSLLHLSQKANRFWEIGD